MRSHKLSHYLRTYRRRAGFTQDELAFLLGCKSGVEVSRYERFRCRPRLPVALAYEAIFNTTIAVLFEGEFQKVEKHVARRAMLLTRKLAKAERLSERMGQLLGAIASGNREANS